MKRLFDTPKLVAAGDCSPKMSFTIWQSGPDTFTAWVYPESMGSPENWKAVDDKYSGSPDLFSDTGDSFIAAMASVLDFTNLVRIKDAVRKKRKAK